MKLSATKLKNLKHKQQPILMVTCYDYQMAQWLNETPIDAILVGDTLGEIIYGFPNTTFVTMDMMLKHTQAVVKGANNIHIIGDMPHRSYDTPHTALANAKKFLAIGASSVKVENPTPAVLAALAAEKIPVCGHVGLTPQTIQNYKKQGTNPQSAQKILTQSAAMQKGNCFALVLEAIPSTLAKEITQTLTIPTIGIAAGRECDGQIRVLYDIAGLTKQEKKFAPPYDQLGTKLKDVITAYLNAYKK